MVWQGDSWWLEVETLLLPNGRRVERGAIRHPGAVVLVPLQADGESLRVVMIRQYRPVLDATILELPAGTRGWDEAWLACAQRELREETGYRAETFTELGQIWPAPGTSDEQMTIYLATELSSDPLPADVDEEIAVEALPLSDLLAMIKDGRIQDAKTIAGLLKTAVYLKLF